MNINPRLEYLPIGASRYEGAPHFYVDFALQKQLKNPKTWAKFVEVFTENADDADLGWRCEYWGKMMRGASLIYTYSKDEELYAVLEDAVRALLRTQRPDGRFSTYSTSLASLLSQEIKFLPLTCANPVSPGRTL